MRASLLALKMVKAGSRVECSNTSRGLHQANIS